MNKPILQRARTEAETALIERFDQGDRRLVGATDLRAAAMQRFANAGLPNRRVEAWHYTDLRRLLSSVPAYDPSAAPSAIAPLVDGSAALAVLNGVAGEAPEIEGVSITPMRDALADGKAATLLGALDRDGVTVVSRRNMLKAR